MMTSDDKVGGWVKKGQNHDDVILEWSLMLVNLQVEIFLKLRVHCITLCFEKSFSDLGNCFEI